MQSLATAPGVMEVLRSSTAEQHLSVELLMPFFRDDFSLQVYRSTLEAFLGFFEPIEELVSVAADWPAIGINFNDRRRAHLLRADLGALGLSHADIANLSRCSFLPAMKSLESALGCL